MIELRRADLDAIEAAAETAYPEECCGLLVGRAVAGGCRVARVVASANVADGDRRRRFEIDPRLLLSLHREVRAGGQAIIGVYHSHPDGAAEPSASDRERASDPALVWLITAVVRGRAGETRAYRAPAGAGGDFRAVALALVD